MNTGGVVALVIILGLLIAGGIGFGTAYAVNKNLEDKYRSKVLATK